MGNSSGQTSESGQALVELTVTLLFVIFVILGGVALSAQLKDKFKHHFLADTPLKNSGSRGSIGEEETSALLSSLQKNLRPFPRISQQKALETLEEEGWIKQETLKVPEGVLILFRKENRKMFLVNDHGEKYGVEF